MKHKTAQSQQSIFLNDPFPAADFALVLEMLQEIEPLGFRIEIFGKNTFLINGIPANISQAGNGIIEGLIEQFKINQSELSVPPVRTLHVLSPGGPR